MTDVQVKLTCSYSNTDLTHQYAFDCAESLVSGVRNKVKAINASLAGGTDGGMSTFFLSADGHNLTKISDARIVSLEEYPIDVD